MNIRYLRFVPFICGAVMMLTLTCVLAWYRYAMHNEQETLRVHLMLDELSKSVSTELRRGEDSLSMATQTTQSGSWHSWHIDEHTASYRNADGSAPSVALQSLERDLRLQNPSKGGIVLLGPYSTVSNQNAVVIVQPVHDGGGASSWNGATILLDDLLPAALTTKFIKQRLRLQLWGASGQVLFESEDGDLQAPVTETVPFSTTRLSLVAAPREGWTLPLRAWASMLLLLLAVLIWLAYELRRGREIRDAAEDLQQAEERRKQINLQYGRAIESVASLEARLQIVSMHDTVTGLANRSSLTRRVEVDLESMRQQQNGTLAVLAIGFDQLQHIINSFGAEFASRVLVVAAERIEFVLPSKNLLYRIGDLQLGVVLPPTNDPSGGVKLADKIIREIEAPIAMDSRTFLLHPSVGIAETTSGYQYVETLLHNANMALSAVERDATTRYCLFDSATAKESVSRLQLEVDLARAFEENQFVLEYEPIVMPVTHAAAGFEALLRWNHPTEGRIPPAHFVPIVVQAGMANKLNSWVMREATRQAAVWHHAGHRSLFVNFNLSAEAFLKDNLEAEVGELLAEFELPGDCLSVELTESTLIQDLRRAARTLQRLHELGVRAWLDDFGTGYSSLSYLRQLPLKGVKIDRSFIERTVVDARDFGFVKSLIDLISYLGMQSIAEGIETKEQYELLSMTTCDLYQGYHFARSMSAAAAESWLIESRRAVKVEKIA